MQLRYVVLVCREKVSDTLLQSFLFCFHLLFVVDIALELSSPVFKREGIIALLVSMNRERVFTTS
jgi:hypothetical protein